MADKPQENKDAKPNLDTTGPAPASPEMRKEAAELALKMNEETAELQRDHKSTGIESKKDRVVQKSSVKQGELIKAEGLPDPKNLPKVAPKEEDPKSMYVKEVKVNLDLPPERDFNEADKNAFISQVTDGSVGQSLNKLALNIDRENTKINAQNWNARATDPAGLKEVYNEFYKLGIKDSNPTFYDQMFAILRNGASESNPYKNGLPQYKVLFMDPLNHSAEIEALPPKPGFVGGALYMKAFQQLQAIQAVVLAQDKMQLATSDKQEKQDKDSLANGAVDLLKDNINTFKTAIKNKDYATAGLYVVGVWAIYKSWQKLTDGKDGLKNKLIYAAAAYCGYEFAKNAGYDILKMAGIKDADYDVKGTPMEIMKRILSKNPKLNEETKDLDYHTVVKMADVNLKSLDDLYKKNNDPEIHFIDPAEFPGAFPDDVLRARPTKMGLGIGLKDGDGMNGIKLGPNEKRYIELGQQIYKLAVAMRGIYDETLKKDEHQVDFFGKSYEEALSSGNHSLGKVRHLMSALDQYAGRAPGESFVGKELVEKVRQDMTEAFKSKPGLGLYIEDKIAEGQFEGRVMGMPVIFVMSEDGKSYKAYLKNKYQGKEVPGPNFMANIPVEGGPARDMAVDNVESNIKMRMAELLEPLSKATPGYTPPRYEGGEWVANITLAGLPEFGVDAGPIKVTVKVAKDGKSLNMVDSTNNTRINVNEDVNKQYPYGVGLQQKITSQPEFHALRIFANVGEFKVTGVDKNTMKVKVNLGKANMPVEFTYNRSTNSFSLDPAAEAALISNPTFGAELIENLGNDEEFELNKTLKDFKKMIAESCSESFVTYFFKSLVGATKKDPLDGVNLDVFSGSVPEGFASMIIDSSKSEVMERLRHAVKGAGSMADVEKARVDVLQDFAVRMRTILETLKKSNAELTRKGENWDRDKFMDEVVGRVRCASSISSHYVQSKADFEYMVYGLNLPGLLTSKSDIGGSESHAAAAKLMGVYAYYTAHLDKIDLDNLAFPAVPHPPLLAQNDPALDGHYRVQYLEYVKDSIIGKASSQSDLSSIPLASARGFWGIEEYEQWKATIGKYEPLNPLDSKKAYEHNEAIHQPHKNAAGKDIDCSHTELDKALMAEYTKTIDLLKREYGDTFNYKAIEDYLSKPLIVNGVENAAEAGILVPYGEEVNGVFVNKCQLWDTTRRINSASHGKRSLQVMYMEREVESLVRFIFTAPGRNGGLKFFKTSPRWTTTLIMKWPWLRHILPN